MTRVSNPDLTLIHFSDGSVYVDPNQGNEFQDIYEQVCYLLDTNNQ
ncbi:hypothetical protein RND81_02G101400 [Saponaria officinalis]|uniref:Uncharacterized protein n=1 Tax=Saponaria officinalis TaxID=3572 RepID=A0AAW1MSV2_SAPOF